MTTLNNAGAAADATAQGAVRRVLSALDACDDLLQCCRVQEGSTCLHRARRFPEEALCRTCRLVKAVEDLEDTAL